MNLPRYPQNGGADASEAAAPTAPMKYLELELRECFARLDRVEQHALLNVARAMAKGKTPVDHRPTAPIGFTPSRGRGWRLGGGV